MKKIIALILVLIMILALVGCGKEKRKIIQLTLSTEDSEAILAAAGVHLPPVEEAPGAGTTVQWFSWFDSFHNYSKDEVVATGYWTFQQKYNGEVEYVECVYAERATALATLLVAGTPPDFAPAGVSNNAMYPMNCIKGMYQPVDPWIDFTDPLWEGTAEAADYFTLGDYHFAIITDLTFKDVVPYNRRVFEDYGYDDPAQLYANDEWTWSKFLELCLDFNDPDSDRFAVDGYYIANSIAEESTGHYIIDRDENGDFFANLDDPVIEAGENIVSELARNDCMYRVGNDYWGINSYGGTPGTRVKDGLTLFWINATYGFTGPVDEIAQTYGDVTENEVMFAPLPRYDDGDGIYYLAANPTGYALVTGATNPEGAVLLAMCDRFKVMDPTVVSVDKKQLKDKYLWTDEMLDMYDTCYDIANANVRTFYTGNLPDNLNDTYNRFDWGIIRSGGANTWAQLKEQNMDSMEYYCEEINAMIDDYQYTGTYTE